MCKENQINQEMQVNNVVMENAQQQQMQQEQAQQQQQAQQQPTEMEQFIQEHENLFVDGKKEKHGKMKFKVARLKGNAVHSHRAILRRDAVQEHLAENCRLDKTLAYSKTCRNALSAIQEYASLDLSKTSTSTQNKKLNAAFKQLEESGEALNKEEQTLTEKKSAMEQKLQTMIAFIEEHSAVEKVPEMQNLILQIVDLDEQFAKLEKDRLLLRQHENYLKPMTNGFLEVPKDREVPKKWKKNYTSRFRLNNPLLSWKNMKNAPLFPHEPSVEDINQGDLGDCYLQAALESLILTQPGRLKDCIRDNDDGTVTVRFFKKFESVDELLPEPKALLDEKLWSNLDGPQFLTRFMSELPAFQTALPGFSKISYLHTPAFLQKQDFVSEKNNFATEEEYKAAIAQLEQEQDRNAKKIMDNINKLFNMNTSLLQHPEKLNALAQKLHDEPLIQTFLEKVHNALTTKPDTKIEPNSLSLFVPCFLETFTNQEELDALIAKYQTAMDEIRTSTGELHPFYVTVTKEIPTIAGQTYYSHGSLAVHMIEKAFVASGLHSDKKNFTEMIQKKAIESLRKKEKTSFENIKTIKDYNELASSGKLTEAQIALFNEEVGLQKDKYITYKNINSGRGKDFLENLLGEKVNCAVHEPETWSSFINNSNAFIITTSMNIPRFNHNPALEEKTAATNAQNAANIAFFLLVQHLEKKVGDLKNWSAQTPITIEDITDTLRDFTQWASGSDLYNGIMENFQRIATPNATEEEQKREFQEFINLLVEFTVEVLEAPENKFAIQHRLFATKTENGRKVALYTPMALDRYEKIQDTLQKGTPIVCGSKRYLPKGVSAKGLNGESVSNGMIEGHAYTVVGCQEIDGHKFVQLRNPWANKIRGYRVRVTPNPDGGEPIVTYEADHIDCHDAQEGQFLMELNDFMIRMNYIDGISQ